MAKTALNASRINAFSMKPEEVTIIGLDTPHKSIDEHPLYDKRIHIPLKEEAVKNVMAIGVRKAVLVTKEGELVPVVDGRQRVRQAREANRRFAEMGLPPIMIPVMLSRGKTLADQLTVSISTNSHRAEEDVLCKADKAWGMHFNGRSFEDIATAFGCSESTAKNLVALGGADSAVIAALREKKISIAKAYSIARKPDREVQVDTLAELLNKPKPTEEEKALEALRKALARFRKLDAYIHDREVAMLVWDLRLRVAPSSQLKEKES